jgi:hypothetical protein
VPVLQGENKKTAIIYEARNEECLNVRINQKSAAVCACMVSASACQRLMGALYLSAAVCAAVTN